MDRIPKNETFECIALVDAPDFNIKKDVHYIVTKDHPLRQMFLNKELFDRVDDPEKCMQVGMTVVMDGMYLKKNIPNRYPDYVWVKVHKSLADIVNIEYISSKKLYMVTLHNASGLTYYFETCSIRKEHPENKKYLNLNFEVYWYISSGGMICRTYVGKSTNKDRFRRASKNYYLNKEEAQARYNQIMHI